MITEPHSGSDFVRCSFLHHPIFNNTTEASSMMILFNKERKHSPLIQHHLLLLLLLSLLLLILLVTVRISNNNVRIHHHHNDGQQQPDDRRHYDQHVDVAADDHASFTLQTTAATKTIKKALIKRNKYRSVDLNCDDSMCANDRISNKKTIASRSNEDEDDHHEQQSVHTHDTNDDKNSIEDDIGDDQNIMSKTVHLPSGYGIVRYHYRYTNNIQTSSNTPTKATISKKMRMNESQSRFKNTTSSKRQQIRRTKDEVATKVTTTTIPSSLPQQLPIVLVILGVGTNMNVQDYDEICQEFVMNRLEPTTSYHVIVFALDPEPYSIFKNSVQKFATNVVYIVQNLDSIIVNSPFTYYYDDDLQKNHAKESSSSCSSSKILSSSMTVIVGGHSVGGMTSFNSFMVHDSLYDQNCIQIHGYIGLDPYKIINTTTSTLITGSTSTSRITSSANQVTTARVRSNKNNYKNNDNSNSNEPYHQMNRTGDDTIGTIVAPSTSLTTKCTNDDATSTGGIKIPPSLVWGFTDTTCYVNVEYAAQMAYMLSNPYHRIYYQLHNNQVNTTSTLNHCSFTNRGCFGCSSTGTSSSNINNEETTKQFKYAVGLSFHRFVQVLLLMQNNNNNTTKRMMDQQQPNQHQQHYIPQDLYINSNANNHNDTTTDATATSSSNNINDFDHNDDPFYGKRLMFDELRTQFFNASIVTSLFYNADIM